MCTNRPVSFPSFVVTLFLLVASATASAEEFRCRVTYPLQKALLELPDIDRECVTKRTEYLGTRGYALLQATFVKGPIQIPC